MNCTILIDRYYLCIAELLEVFQESHSANKRF